MTQLGRGRLPHTSSLSVQHLLLTAVFVLLLGVLAACGGDGDVTPGPNDTGVPVSGTALTCSQECADRGQCGESPDRGSVVLLNLERPTVTAVEHDLAIPGGTAVNVIEERSVTVVENATNVEFPLNFYRVYVPERNVEAWVAGWCIINP